MIFDIREALIKYADLYPGVSDAVSFLAEKCKASSPENGRYNISERCCANVFDYETSDAEKDFEVHAAYIDLMIIFEGEETLMFAPEEKLSVTEDKMKSDDYRLLSGKEEGRYILSTSNFALIMPGEAHKTGICAREGVSEYVKKAVFKIKI